MQDGSCSMSAAVGFPRSEHTQDFFEYLVKRGSSLGLSSLNMGPPFNYTHYSSRLLTFLVRRLSCATVRSTYAQLVKQYFPRAKHPTAMFILWETTAFPCCGAEHVEKQLAELAAKIRPRKRGWVRRLKIESERMYREMARLSAMNHESDI